MTHAQERVEAASDLKDVELMRPGTWRLASGEMTFEEKHLHAAAEYAKRTGARPSPVKIGHTDPRFTGDGEPALGWLGNLRVEDRDGLVLLGDITGMPDWLAEAAPTAWPDRSVEGWMDYQDDEGKKWPFVIDALALLGVQPPGVSSLKSLRDLPQLVGVAASAARRIIARAPQTTAPEAEEPIQKGAGRMHDPAKIREALSLATDASDDEVKAALVTAGFAAPPPTVGNSDQVLAANAQKAGLITIDPAQLEQYQAGMVRAAALAKRLEGQERDTAIATAVKAGKFPPARKEHYERLWDADPDGTRGLIESLAPGLVPVTAMGYSGEDDTDLLDAEFARLFPPTTKEASRG